MNFDTVFFSFMIGELGWAVSRWQGYCRYLAKNKYQGKRILLADYNWRYPLYSDFVDEFIELPKWFIDLGLEQDCYEAVPHDATPGATTPVDVYAALIKHFEQYYNPGFTKVIRTPRGCNFWAMSQVQMWGTLTPSKEAEAYVNSLLYNVKREIVLVSARGRARTPQRNVPEAVWNDLVDILAKRFTVVITGTPTGSFLADKYGRNIINVIQRNNVDGLDVLIGLLHRSFMSVTSQSGPTLISLLCECPSYIVGHEKMRHTKYENPLKTPCMFREVPYEIYSAINAETMANDIATFYDILCRKRDALQHAMHYVMNDSKLILNDFIQKSIKNRFVEVNVQEMQQELMNEQ